jgi:hypothetical protein
MCPAPRALDQLHTPDHERAAQEEYPVEIKQPFVADHGEVPFMDPNVMLLDR